MKWLHFFIVSLFLCSVNNTFAISKSKQFVIQRGNKTFLVSNSQEYEIYRIITVKYTDLLKLQNKYIVRRFNKLSYADIDIPNNISIDSFVDELEKDTNIQQIDYNGYGNYQALVPNDSRISHQWYLSLIRANEAWEITTGSPLIKVGILDSGTDWLHPDLGMGSDSYQNIYCNPNEDDWSNSNDPTTGNNTDDDNNNLIDDYKGWNFVTNTNDCRTTVMHGTFVAGIIGAKTNNNIGIAGIAGGNNSKGVSILPYCVGIEEPKSDIIDDAIIAAVDNGCHIIQFSLSTPYTRPIATALEYAKSQNVIVVCCSGNHSMDSLSYPAYHPSVIAVGAIDQNSRKASFSNYGTNLSVVAPGVDIYSTTLSSNLYGYSEGTSFAAPQVSAVIALMLSVNSYLSCDEVRNIIESTAQKIEGYTFDVRDDSPNGTWNEKVGYGIVDAYAAVLAAKTKYIQNHTYQSGSVIVENYPEIIAGYAVTDNKPYGNVILEAGSDVTYSATEQVVLKPGFHATAGSNLHIKIEDAIANIAASPQQVAPRRSSAPTDDANSTNEEFDNNGLETVASNRIVSTSIYTISGQLIQTIYGGQHDATHLPNGMYILQHRMSDGNVRSEKIANNK